MAIGTECCCILNVYLGKSWSYTAMADILVSVHQPTQCCACKCRSSCWACRPLSSPWVSSNPFLGTKGIDHRWVSPCPHNFRRVRDQATHPTPAQHVWGQNSSTTSCVAGERPATVYSYHVPLETLEVGQQSSRLPWRQTDRQVTEEDPKEVVRGKHTWRLKDDGSGATVGLKSLIGYLQYTVTKVSDVSESATGSQWIRWLTWYARAR